MHQTFGKYVQVFTPGRHLRAPQVAPMRFPDIKCYLRNLIMAIAHESALNTCNLCGHRAGHFVKLWQVSLEVGIIRCCPIRRPLAELDLSGLTFPVSLPRQSSIALKTPD